MPKACGICTSTHAEEVNQALVSGLGVRIVAAQFGFSKTRVHEHKRRCIAALIQAAAGDERKEQGNKLFEQMKALQRATLQVLSAALKNGDASGVLAAVREARQNVETMGRMLGHISTGAKSASLNLISVNISDETAKRMAHVYLQRHGEPKGGTDARSQ
jgi:hypothetical protein